MDQRIINVELSRIAVVPSDALPKALKIVVALSFEPQSEMSRHQNRFISWKNLRTGTDSAVGNISGVISIIPPRRLPVSKPQLILSIYILDPLDDFFEELWAVAAIDLGSKQDVLRALELTSRNPERPFDEGIIWVMLTPAKSKKDFQDVKHLSESEDWSYYEKENNLIDQEVSTLIASVYRKGTAPSDIKPTRRFKKKYEPQGHKSHQVVNRIPIEKAPKRQSYLGTSMNLGSSDIMSEREKEELIYWCDVERSLSYRLRDHEGLLRFPLQTSVGDVVKLIMSCTVPSDDESSLQDPEKFRSKTLRNLERNGRLNENHPQNILRRWALSLAALRKISKLIPNLIGMAHAVGRTSATNSLFDDLRNLHYHLLGLCWKETHRILKMTRQDVDRIRRISEEIVVTRIFREGDSTSTLSIEERPSDGVLSRHKKDRIFKVIDKEQVWLVIHPWDIEGSANDFRSHMYLNVALLYSMLQYATELYERKKRNVTCPCLVLENYTTADKGAELATRINRIAGEEGDRWPVFSYELAFMEKFINDNRDCLLTPSHMYKNVYRGVVLYFLDSSYTYAKEVMQDITLWPGSVHAQLDIITNAKKNNLIESLLKSQAQILRLDSYFIAMNVDAILPRHRHVQETAIEAGGQEKRTSRDESSLTSVRKIRGFDAEQLMTNSERDLFLHRSHPVWMLDQDLNELLSKSESKHEEHLGTVARIPEEQSTQLLGYAVADLIMKRCTTHLCRDLNDLNLQLFDTKEWDKLLSDCGIGSCKQCVRQLMNKLSQRQARKFLFTTIVGDLASELYDYCLKTLTRSSLDLHHTDIQHLYLYPELLSELPADVASFLLDCRGLVEIYESETTAPVLPIEEPLELQDLLMLNIFNLILGYGKDRDFFWNEWLSPKIAGIMELFIGDSVKTDETADAQQSYTLLYTTLCQKLSVRFHSRGPSQAREKPFNKSMVASYQHQIETSYKSDWITNAFLTTVEEITLLPEVLDQCNRSAQLRFLKDLALTGFKIGCSMQDEYQLTTYAADHGDVSTLNDVLTKAITLDNEVSSNMVPTIIARLGGILYLLEKKLDYAIKYFFDFYDPLDHAIVKHNKAGRSGLLNLSEQSVAHLTIGPTEQTLIDAGMIQHGTYAISQLITWTKLHNVVRIVLHHTNPSQWTDQLLKWRKPSLFYDARLNLMDMGSQANLLWQAAEQISKHTRYIVDYAHARYCYIRGDYETALQYCVKSYIAFSVICGDETHVACLQERVQLDRSAQTIDQHLKTLNAFNRVGDAKKAIREHLSLTQDKPLYEKFINWVGKQFDLEAYIRSPIMDVDSFLHIPHSLQGASSWLACERCACALILIKQALCEAEIPWQDIEELAGPFEQWLQKVAKLIEESKYADFKAWCEKRNTDLLNAGQEEIDRRNEPIVREQMSALESALGIKNTKEESISSEAESGDDNLKWEVDEDVISLRKQDSIMPLVKSSISMRTGSQLTRSALTTSGERSFDRFIASESRLPWSRSAASFRSAHSRQSSFASLAQSAVTGETETIEPNTIAGIDEQIQVEVREERLLEALRRERADLLANSHVGESAGQQISKDMFDYNSLLKPNTGMRANPALGGSQMLGARLEALALAAMKELEKAQAPMLSQSKSELRSDKSSQIFGAHQGQVLKRPTILAMGTEKSVSHGSSKSSLQLPIQNSLESSKTPPNQSSDTYLAHIRVPSSRRMSIAVGKDIKIVSRQLSEDVESVGQHESSIPASPGKTRKAPKLLIKKKLPSLKKVIQPPETQEMPPKEVLPKRPLPKTLPTKPMIKTPKAKREPTKTPPILAGSEPAEDELVKRSAKAPPKPGMKALPQKKLMKETPLKKPYKKPGLSTLQKPPPPPPLKLTKIPLKKPSMPSIVKKSPILMKKLWGKKASSKPLLSRPTTPPVRPSGPVPEEVCVADDNLAAETNLASAAESSSPAFQREVDAERLKEVDVRRHSIDEAPDIPLFDQEEQIEWNKQVESMIRRLPSDKTAVRPIIQSPADKTESATFFSSGIRRSGKVGARAQQSIVVGAVKDENALAHMPDLLGLQPPKNRRSSLEPFHKEDLRNEGIKKLVRPSRLGVRMSLLPQEWEVGQEERKSDASHESEGEEDVDNGKSNLPASISTLCSEIGLFQNRDASIALRKQKLGDAMVLFATSLPMFHVERDRQAVCIAWLGFALCLVTQYLDQPPQLQVKAKTKATHYLCKVIETSLNYWKQEGNGDLILHTAFSDAIESLGTLLWNHPIGLKILVHLLSFVHYKFRAKPLLNKQLNKEPEETEEVQWLTEKNCSPICRFWVRLGHTCSYERMILREVKILNEVMKTNRLPASYNGTLPSTLSGWKLTSPIWSKCLLPEANLITEDESLIYLILDENNITSEDIWKPLALCGFLAHDSFASLYPLIKLTYLVPHSHFMPHIKEKILRILTRSITMVEDELFADSRDALAVFRRLAVHLNKVWIEEKHNAQLLWQERQKLGISKTKPDMESLRQIRLNVRQRIDEGIQFRCEELVEEDDFYSMVTSHNRLVERFWLVMGDGWEGPYAILRQTPMLEALSNKISVPKIDYGHSAAASASERIATSLTPHHVDVYMTSLIAKATIELRYLRTLFPSALASEVGLLHGGTFFQAISDLYPGLLTPYIDTLFSTISHYRAFDDPISGPPPYIEDSLRKTTSSLAAFDEELTQEYWSS